MATTLVFPLPHTTFMAEVAYGNNLPVHFQGWRPLTSVGARAPPPRVATTLQGATPEIHLTPIIRMPVCKGVLISQPSRLTAYRLLDLSRGPH